ERAGRPRSVMNSRRLITAPKHSGHGIVSAQTSTLEGRDVRASQCPLWVKSRHVQRAKACPLYPRKRTCAVQEPMSALGHKRTSVLFDHLIRALLNRQRDKNVKRPGGFEIDDHLELDRGLDRKLVWLGALENSIGVSSGASVVVAQVAAIGH